MAVTLKITSNRKQVSQKFKKFQSVLSRVIDKGVKQAGFQLVDIIRTKTQKGIDFRDRPFSSLFPNPLVHLFSSLFFFSFLKALHFL